MAYSTIHPSQRSTTARSTGSGGKAVAGFLSGLVGLLFANLLLGPLAITLGILALRDDTPRRARAVLGIGLGVADIVVFAALMLHSVAVSGGPTWRFSSF
jgi:hypothetical protein